MKKVCGLQGRQTRQNKIWIGCIMLEFSCMYVFMLCMLTAAVNGLQMTDAVFYDTSRIATSNKFVNFSHFDDGFVNV